MLEPNAPGAGAAPDYVGVHGALQAGGLDLVFCEECGVVWNYDVRTDCPLCHWSEVVR